MEAEGNRILHRIQEVLSKRKALLISFAFGVVVLTALILGVRYARPNSLRIDELSMSVEEPAAQEEFLLIVIAWRRHKSFKRLMESVRNAEYHGHKVSIKFVVEANPRKEIVEYISHFEWEHGDVLYDFKQVKHGLEKNIISAWEPKNDNEYAIFLEDDIEVSKHFFSFILDVFAKHQDEFKHGTEDEKRIAGISLMLTAINELKGGVGDFSKYKRSGQYGYFLLCLPCSWGAVYFPQKWRDFLEYYRMRKKHTPQDVFPVENISSNRWRNSWKKYYIEFMALSGLYFLYPDYPRRVSFSTNHLEIGEHVWARGNERGKSSEDELRGLVDPMRTPPLVTKYLPEMRKALTRLEDYPVFDLIYRKVDSLFALYQMGVILEESFHKKTKMLRRPSHEQCVLDVFGREKAVPGNERKIYSELSGGLSDEIRQAILLVQAADILQRVAVLPSEFRNRLAGVSVRAADVFDFSGGNVFFYTGKQFLAGGPPIRRIDPVGEKRRLSLSVFNELGMIPVPTAYNSPLDVRKKYGACEDTVLHFASFEDVLYTRECLNGKVRLKGKYENTLSGMLRLLGKRFKYIDGKDGLESIEFQVIQNETTQVFYVHGIPRTALFMVGFSFYNQDDILSEFKRTGEDGTNELVVAVIEAELRRISI
eukprot:GHVN01067856.1.p2 GENE.GHVN01067856.1~~GHVN01067856.1.p2  ORF type:complete len:651 (+),score=59.23 GHVN01067856.1:2-1954(+)